MSTNKTNRIHFGWFVALMCFLIQGAAYGIVSNTRGVFFNSVCQDLGVQLGQLTRSYVFYAIVTVAAIPLASKIIPKANLRILLSFFGVLIASSVFLFGSCTKLYQIYLLSCVQGLSVSFLVVMTVNLLINNWFIKSKGLVLAICGAASSLFGAVFSVVSSNIIAKHGWRFGFRFLSVVVFVMIVPAALAFAVYRPQLVGMKPYGWKQAEEAVEASTAGEPHRLEGVPKKVAVRSAAFYLLLLGMLCTNCLSQISQIFPGYGESIGMGTKAALLTTTMMITSLIFKVAFGEMSDTIGIRTTLIIANLLGCIGGLILILFGDRANILTFVGAGLISTPMATSLVLSPLWTMGLFGQRDFASIMSYVQIVAHIAAPSGVSIMGAIVDAGGYGAFKVTCFIIVFVLFVLCEMSFVFSKKLSRTEGDFTDVGQ